MVLRLALNYGARQGIADAARRLSEEVLAGRLRPSDIDEEALRRFLYDPAMPDPDLLVRTAGELRLSNFFLWQASYTEVWVTDVLWPEFDVPHLEEALAAYGRRDRKFGGIEAVPASPALGGGAGTSAPGRR